MSNKKDNNKDNIDKIIEDTFSHIKDIVDANTVVGTTIELAKNLFIIPVSKISVGLITGGGSLPKAKKNEFNAGSGTGFNIVPIGFVTISSGVIDFIPVAGDNFEKNMVEMILKIYDKLANKESENSYEED